jgi:Raf kinase inhibitor-like YbhB/YbcL family protein
VVGVIFMKLTTKAIKEGKRIPGKYGFCVLTPEGVKMGDNINPDFSWSDVPAGTKSLALICHDSDVPSKPDKVNKEGMTVPKDLPRVDFYHWVLIDIPATSKGIKEGEFSKGITPHGKKEKKASQGTRQGVNNYTDWFKGDKDMEGDYYGYDGPCPPWNDSIIHHYHFTLYALDLERLKVPEKFGGPEVLKAMKDHILGQVKITGTYTLNKDLA